MQCTAAFGTGIPYVTLSVLGTVEVSALRGMLRSVVADPRWRPGRTWLYDLREADTSGLTGEDLVGLGRLAVSLGAELGEARIAAVVSTPLAYAQGRQASAWMEPGPARMALFYSHDEALEWLRHGAPEEP